MTYSIGTVKDLMYSTIENEFYYDGIVTIIDDSGGEAKCRICYHEPAFGLPFLTLLKKKDFDQRDNTPEIDVVLRSGYEPVYKKGKRSYGKFLDENGDKLMGDFARVAHSNKSYACVWEEPSVDVCWKTFFLVYDASVYCRNGNQCVDSASLPSGNKRGNVQIK